ncbi:MAG: ATP-binding cassette domain-containing protein, partial [Chloroflexota bacterium]
MSELVRIQNLVKYYGNALILNGIDLTISAGDRMVLVGENGAGKSTLMRHVVGELTPDSGTVWTPEGLDIGYLPQETHLTDLSLNINQFLSQAVGDLESIQQEMSKLEAEMGKPEVDLDAVLEAYGQLQTLFEQRGGYDLEHRFEMVLNGLGLNGIGLERQLSTLSGGEKRRAALAGLLLQGPQLLILDEPTNHLDFAALEWLEGYLKTYPHTLVVISHDRRFINTIVNVIAELSPKDKQLVFYHGNYEFYLAERERQFLKRVALWEEQQAEKRHLEQLIKKEVFARGGGKAPADGDKMAFKKKVATSEKTAAKAIQNAKQRLTELED